MAYPTITLSEVIASVFTRLDIEDSRDELVFQDWAWDAIREIGPTRVDRKTTCLDVTDLCIQKPHDFLYAIDLNLLDETGGIHYYQFAESGFSNSEQQFNRARDFLSTSVNTHGSSSIKVAEQKHHFELSSNASKSPISQAELNYYHYPIDEDGDILVEEKLKEAIIAFIEYMYIKRERRRKVGTRDIPLAEVQDSRIEWKKKRAEVRGDIKMPDPNSFATLAAKWVTGIANYKRKARFSRISRYSRRY